MGNALIVSGELDGESMLFVIFVTCTIALTVVFLMLSLIFGWIRRRKRKD